MTSPTSPPSRRRKLNPGRRFFLVRNRDISGVSGTGIVAEGVEFHDKQVVLSWFGKFHSLEVHPSIEQVLNVHGHGGATGVFWIDSEDTWQLETLSPLQTALIS